MNAKVLMPLVLVAGTAPAAAQTRLPKPVIGTPTVVATRPPGPSWITVGSDYPTNFVIKWTVVPSASSYRILRWPNGDTRYLQLRKDVPATTANSTTEPGYATYSDNIGILLNTTYSYQIEAVFLDITGTKTYSAKSPVASAMSVPYLAPANLYYTATNSVEPGLVRVNLTWDAVPAAASYHFTGTYTDPRGGSYDLRPDNVAPTLLVIIDGAQKFRYPTNGTLLRYHLYPGNTYTFCLSTIYPGGIRDETVKKCLTATL